MKRLESPASTSGSISIVKWLGGLLVGLGGLLVAILLVSSLVHGWEYKKELAGDYILLAVDVREQMNISRMLPGGNAVGVVGETVFAVGWNNDFIIAKQHQLGAGPRKGTHAANFYILRVSNGEVYGPLTAAQFSAERSAQAVPSGLDFTLVFEDLE
ncbi:DUF3997 domain-containing protein [Stigmatella hybrida]|uniref:DUF3997 domain-containing protein n=1 Tax=Stigmatella hybrida TaxID=394097 RepID=UPI001CDB35D5|nr:DUF3997 domain-containing protein [Stigmatella hybrida]